MCFAQFLEPLVTAKESMQNIIGIKNAVRTAKSFCRIFEKNFDDIDLRWDPLAQVVSRMTDADKCERVLGGIHKKLKSNSTPKMEFLETFDKHHLLMLGTRL